MDERAAEADTRGNFAELDYRIHRVEMERAQRRLAYVEGLCPNTLPGKVAFQETLVMALGALLILVLPVLGLMWLDQPDGLDGAGWVWLTYAAGLVSVGLVQCGRTYQAARAQQAAIQQTWVRFNADGWPPLTEMEEAAHRGTSLERLLELASTADFDVLIVVGENPNVPPAALELFAEHADPLVRLRAAWHPNTPSGARERLLDDPDEGVRDAARTHS